MATAARIEISEKSQALRLLSTPEEVALRQRIVQIRRYKHRNEPTEQSDVRSRVRGRTAFSGLAHVNPSGPRTTSVLLWFSIGLRKRGRMGHIINFTIPRTFMKLGRPAISIFYYTALIVRAHLMSCWTGILSL